MHNVNQTLIKTDIVRLLTLFFKMNMTAFPGPGPLQHGTRGPGHSLGAGGHDAASWHSRHQRSVSVLSFTD